MTVISDALVEHTVNKAAVYDKFQFERIGFFSVDPDSSKQKVRIFYFLTEFLVLLVNTCLYSSRYCMCPGPSLQHAVSMHDV